MNELLELRLEHDQPGMDGLITFDGETVEVFGFNDIHSVRMPIRLIDEVTVSFKSGLIAQPNITFQGARGGLGYTQAIEPPDAQQPEIDGFAAAVNAAIQERA
ncbi:MAG: hypothetical protein KDB52_01415 [Solirubrobacterales bacterium]|nr:hypothetical protein [Solirubrobacterales bacterium]